MMPGSRRLPIIARHFGRIWNGRSPTCWPTVPRIPLCRKMSGSLDGAGTAYGPQTVPSTPLQSDYQLVVDLDELHDDVGELRGDQLLVRGRGGVRVVGGLVGEVLDEQQVVDVGRIAVHAERQRALL